MKLKVGQRLVVKARHPEGGASYTAEVAVCELYRNFCVLSTGKFKTCAFYGDIARGEVITI